MGTAKRMMEQRDAAWDHLAAVRGWRCEICVAPIPFEERILFFETHLCSWCAHIVNKDD
jgi:hypothetical protein